MQVILLEKLPNLGSLGDIVKVKAGYARNYLIPKGKAKRATESNVAAFEARRAELERAQSDIAAASQARAAQLEGVTIQVAQKAGVDGRLFGSVTNSDISEALKAQGFDVAKASVRLPHGPLKQEGEHEVVIDLHTDAKATIKVSVVGEQ
jgi:large subunit ribosomal protein L9